VGEAGVSVVDGNNLAALLTIPLGRQPFAVAVDADTGVTYAGDRLDGTIHRIDAIPGIG
jgi:DNA-binding beta-propeller fold protein YncE